MTDWRRLHEGLATVHSPTLTLTSKMKRHTVASKAARILYKTSDREPRLHRGLDDMMTAPQCLHKLREPTVVAPLISMDIVRYRMTGPGLLVRKDQCVIACTPVHLSSFDFVALVWVKSFPQHLFAEWGVLRCACMYV